MRWSEYEKLTGKLIQEEGRLADLLDTLPRHSEARLGLAARRSGVDLALDVLEKHQKNPNSVCPRYKRVVYSQ